MKTTADLDRLAMRARPEGTPVIHQNINNLLFMHWPIDPSLIRPLIPSKLEIDTFEDKAWIAITPFALTGMQWLSLPSVPGFRSFLEVNVRTCVHYHGTPGIWFLSLDASRVIPTIAARLLFALPYFKAEMKFVEKGGELLFSSKRLMPPTAEFEARWRIGVRLREPHVDSLAFFLMERYCGFSGNNGHLKMTRIYHAPWILDEAIVLSHSSTMLSALGLPESSDPPLAHFSRSMTLEVWEPQPVSRP